MEMEGVMRGRQMTGLVTGIVVLALAGPVYAQTQPPEGNPCQGEDTVDTNPDVFYIDSDQIGRLNIADVHLAVVIGTPDSSVLVEPVQTIRVPVGRLTRTAYPGCWSGEFTPQAGLIADGKTLYSVFFRLVNTDGFIGPVKPGKGSPFVAGSATPDPTPEPLRAPNGRVGRSGG
jgi:hypothetical protein